MGQYWHPINVDKKEFVKVSGLKVMEHSWIKNPGMNRVMHLLTGPWAKDRIVWMGDYSDDDPYHYLYDQARCISDGGWDDKYGKCYVQGYIINHTKKEYVSLENYIKNIIRNYSDSDWIIHPLSLMTAADSMGDGGGDYHSDIGHNFIGMWRHDSIEVAENFDASGFEEILPVFSESNKLSIPRSQEDVDKIYQSEYLNYSPEGDVVEFSTSVSDNSNTEGIDIDEEISEDFDENEFIAGQIENGYNSGTLPDGRTWAITIGE